VVHVDGEHYDYKQWHDWYADKENGVTINSDIYSGFSYKDAVNAVAHALARRPHLLSALMGALGDFLPPRELLRLAFSR